MEVLESLFNCKVKPKPFTHPSVVTIGNFDGCHLGHQKLIEAAKHYQLTHRLKTIALTFSPRPEAFFSGQSDEKTLFSPALKKLAFAQLGFDALLIENLNLAFSQMSHGRFYEEILKGYLQAKAIVVGENFRFGYRRAGDSCWLQKRALDDQTLVTIASPLHWQNAPISSTRIRQALQEGQIKAANAMLGRPYGLFGQIEQGDQLGRSLEMPTANLGAIEQLIPAHGVYTGYVWLGGEKSDQQAPLLAQPAAELIPAVFNLGTRPSIGQGRAQQQGPVRVEGHLLTGSYELGALYGQKAAFYLIDYLRPEKRFDELAALKEQMQKDRGQAKEKLGLR